MCCRTMSLCLLMENVKGGDKQGKEDKKCEEEVSLQVLNNQGRDNRAG